MTRSHKFLKHLQIMELQKRRQLITNDSVKKKTKIKYLNVQRFL